MRDQFEILLTRTGTRFWARADEPVLAAATRSAIWLPAGCRNGTCGACEATLVSGQLANGNDAAAAGAKPSVRLCVARALSDLIVDVDVLTSRPSEPASLLPARVVSLDAGADGRQPSFSIRLPAAARSRAVMVRGVRVSIKSPRGFGSAFVVMAVGPDRLVALQSESLSSEQPVSEAQPLPEVGLVLQIEVLRPVTS